LNAVERGYSRSAIVGGRSHFGDRAEIVWIYNFVANSGIKRFDLCASNRLCRLDEMQRDLDLFGQLSILRLQKSDPLSLRSVVGKPRTKAMFSIS
jgi:hypothetical protein